MEDGFWETIGEAMKQRKCRNIGRKIAKLGDQRRALRHKAILLTREREALLGQELTALPRSMQRTA